MRPLTSSLQLPHQHKIVIAGNHELTFDPALRGMEQDLGKAGVGGKCGHLGTSPLHISVRDLSITGQGEKEKEEESCRNIRSELTGCTYLEDSSVLIRGLKIYGE